MKVLSKPLNKAKILQSIIMAFLASISLNLSLRVITERELVEDMGIKNAGKLFKFIWDVKMSSSGYRIESIIVWLALAAVIYIVIMKDRRVYLAEFLLAAVFTFFVIFGYSYKTTASWDCIFATGRNVLKSLISAIGYMCLFYTAIRGLMMIINVLPFRTEKENPWKYFTNNKKSIFAVAIILLLAWLPYLISYFPGLTNYDFFDMLDSFYGNNTNSIRVTLRLDPNVTMNNNNPVLQTLIGVAIMKIGTGLGSPYAGLFLFVAIQTIIYVFVLSYMIYYLAYRKVNRVIRIIITAIFALVPVHSNYAFTTLKDTNFSFIMLLYIICLVEFLTNTKSFMEKKRNLAFLVVLSLLVMFLRNNGVFVTIFTAIPVIIVMRQYWKKLVPVLILPIIFYYFVTGVVYPAFYISPGNAVAAYSIPVQQLARLATEKPGAIEKEDIEKINKVFNFEAFEKRYNPELADPVMSSFKKERTAQEWSDFMGVWSKYLAKYPTVFVQATMNGAYGYFYPSAYNWITYTEITPPAKTYGMVPYTDLEPYHTEATKLIYALGSIPGIGMFASIGFYVWMLAFILVYVIRNRRLKSILVLVPLLTLVLTSIASPANTMFRYVYPIVVCTPVLFALLGTIGKSDKKARKISHTFAICAYKESEYLEECIQSVKDQTVKTDVILATSTPNEYIAGLCQKYEIPMYVNEGESGITQDWNFAYSCADSECVTIAHQDDIYASNYVEELMASVEEVGKPIIFFTNYGELRNGEKVHNNKLLKIKRIMLIPMRIFAFRNSKFIRRRVLSMGCPICCPSVTMFKENCPRRVFSHGFRSDEDWEAWEKLSRRSGAFVYNKEILMYHRIHEDSETSKILGDNARTEEDFVMFSKFWPKGIARFLTKVYGTSEESNNL
ncbi:DUF6020 family protein [Eubacterium xylanophilum]|uniref:DUF6020 family protein n=1 Tax=Eubacterium xylanophilum TaxID=39497 RepID=UPI0004ADB1E5